MSKSRAQKKVFIIAEAGVNHNGSVRIAKKLIDAAKSSCADAVKFQTFRADSLVSKCAPKADYQKNNAHKNENQLSMIKRLELDEDSHKLLIKYCRKKDIIFLSSSFDLMSVDLLDKLGLNIFKIPSGEITNTPYLKKIGALNKKVIMSTGMADLKEIKDALDVLVSAGTKKQNITILHCTTQYPLPAEDVNLRAMITMRDVFGVNVGYSDHTVGIEVALAAVALGACVIEKHFTLDRNMQGPDHKASIEPDGLKAMVQGIRIVERALGDGIKAASPKEEKIKKVARKSIVAKIDILKGTRIKDDMLDIKRPGTGIAPLFLKKIAWKKARINIAKDRPIKLTDLI